MPAEPRRRDRARTEAALVEAALEEFSLHGFKAATTRAIAARAGCSEALIQNYFGGKDGLLVAVMRAGADLQQEALQGPYFSRPPAATPEAEIADFLRSMSEGLRRLAPRLRVLLDRVMLDPVFARRFAETTPRNALVERLAQRFARDWPHTPAPALVAEMVVSVGFELGFVHPVLLLRSDAEIAALAAGYAAVLAPALRVDAT